MICLFATCCLFAGRPSASPSPKNFADELSVLAGAAVENPRLRSAGIFCVDHVGRRTIEDEDAGEDKNGAVEGVAPARSFVIAAPMLVQGAPDAGGKGPASAREPRLVMARPMLALEANIPPAACTKDRERRRRTVE